MRNHLKSCRGGGPLIYVVVAGVLALAAFMFKPRALDGDSRRADASVAASKDVEKAHDDKDKAVKQKSSEAAASVEVMSSVIAVLPESPEKTFLVEEGKVVKSKLEPPDPMELLAAEKRKVAILTGQVEEGHRLYALAFQHTKELEEKLSAADAKIAEKEAQREAVDLKLQQTASERLGAERQRNQILVALAVLVVLYLYTKVTHLSPNALAEAVKDIKGGTPGVQALDSVTTRTQQAIARFIQKHFH